MNSFEKFRSAVPQEDKDAYNFDASTCRAGTGSNKHDYNKYHFCRFGPEIEICCREPGTCHDCNYLKDCKPERIKKSCTKISPEQKVRSPLAARIRAV